MSTLENILTIHSQQKASIDLHQPSSIKESVAVTGQAYRHTNASTQ